MQKPYANLLICVALGLAAGVAQAERADRDKPMNIEADAMRYDDLKQINVFTGQVVMTKGTIVMRGARIEVRKDAQGYQFGVATGEPGKRAFFRQKREGLDEYMEGEGEVVEYDGRTDKVTFTRRAVLRRYLGTQLNDEVTGGVIVYDNVTEVFTVDAGKPSSGAGNGPGGSGRVRAVLTPQPAASAASAPAAPGAPTQPLRPSPRLDGGKN